MRSGVLTNILVFFLIGFCVSGCATTRLVRMDEGATPENLKTMEEEILDTSERFQEIIADRGALYEDEELKRYVNKIARTVIPPDIENEDVQFKIHIIRDPRLNAFTFPDGKIYVHTGLLSRLRNEAQLAFVLAHEISHVINRDSLYFKEDYHNKTVAAKLFDIALTPAYIVVPYGGFIELGLGVTYAASVTGYGRDLEARSDEEALTFLQSGAYSMRGAVDVFDIFLAEKERYKKGMEIYFLSSHPSNERRKKDIAELMTEEFADYAGDVLGAETYERHVLEARCENAALNIRFGRYFHALDDIERVLEDLPQYPLAHYYKGEVYRQMTHNRHKLKEELNTKEWRKIQHEDEVLQREQWLNAAIDAYTRVIEYDPAYAPPYKGLALVYQEQGNYEKAEYHFEKYLQLEPEAKDERFIMRCLQDLDMDEGEEGENE